jgi:AraC-like DNA-binding protein
MIITSLPNSNRFDAGSPPPAENTVIIADTHDKYFYPEHTTPYLFVTNVLNRGQYLVNKRHIEVSARQFYFLNANDTIEIRFSKADRLKTCLILFKEGFVEDCSLYLTGREEDLLEAPDQKPSREARFPNVPLELNGVIQAAISDLLQAHHKEDLDDTLFELIAEAHRLGGQASQRMRRIGATKSSTKEELYRRLAAAREFMQDNLSRNLTIEAIAGEVCLNKFHFLSTFKEVFNTTPHRYFTELRLQKALALLQTQQHSVTEVCFLLGFESPGSFSTLFKKRFGIPPSKIPNFR